MEITDQEISAFQDAYEIDFGEAINADQAREMLTRLVILYERLAEPLPALPKIRYD
jgi:hypothetical protein